MKSDLKENEITRRLVTTDLEDTVRDKSFFVVSNQKDDKIRFAANKINVFYYMVIETVSL